MNIGNSVLVHKYNLFVVAGRKKESMKVRKKEQTLTLIFLLGFQLQF